MKDSLGQRSMETAVINATIDRLITQVWEMFPDDGEARLRIYRELSEKFLGLHDALRPPCPPNLLEDLRKVQAEEQSDV